MTKDTLVKPCLPGLSCLVLLAAACAGGDGGTAPEIVRANARVQVLDDVGYPIVTRVNLTAADGTTFSAATAGDSAWAEFSDVPVGDYVARPELTPEYRMEGPEEQALAVKSTIVARTTFIARLRAGVVNGTVIDSSGALVGGAALELRRGDGAVWAHRTSALGAFLFPRTPIGSYQLVLTDTMLQPRPPVALTVAENETRSVLFTVAVPSDGSWATARAMQYPRGGHVTVQLGTDVYVLGGEGPWTILEPRVERFRNGSWSTVTSLPVPVRMAAGAAVGNRIYVIGGWDERVVGPALQHVQIYDAGTGTWSQGAQLPYPNITHAAVALDGRIHVLGGGTGSRDHLVYDPASDAWSTRAPVPHSASSPVAAALGGFIYLLRGELLLRYDPASDSWIELAMAKYQHYMGAAAARSGKLYIFGGFDSSRLTTTWIPEVYDPITNHWAQLRAMPDPRGEFGAAVLSDGIYVFGGAPESRGTLIYSTTVARFTAR